jgi:hypothetical protein
MGCAQYPHGRDAPSVQRSNATPICACHSTAGCTGALGRARQSRHQDPCISTTDRSDQGPCTERRRSHQSHKARWLRQSRVVALQVGTPIYIYIYLCKYIPKSIHLTIHLTIHIYIYMYIYMCVCECVCVCVYIYVCVCVCVCVCV